MKFSRSLVFNCVPEWSEHYIAYTKLRKLIEKIECAQINSSPTAGNSENVLTSNDASTSKEGLNVNLGSGLASELESNFLSVFNGELAKVGSFYRDELERLKKAKNALEYRLKGVPVPESKEDAVKPDIISIAENAKSLYLHSNDVSDFITINNQGFTKTIRKHDKHCRVPLNESIQEAVDRALPTSDVEGPIRSSMDLAESTYAKYICGGSREEALSQLKTVLREKLVMARSSVWQEMAAMERKIASVQLEDSTDSDEKDAPIKGAPKQKKAHVLRNTFIKLGFMLALFLIICLLPLKSILLIPDKDPVGDTDLLDQVLNIRQRGLAMVVFVVGLWLTETFPAYVTAMLVPILVITLGLYKYKAGSHESFDYIYNNLKNKKAYRLEICKKILYKAMDSKGLQLLGGASISAAATKFGIARLIAVKTMALSGGRPELFILLIMMLCLLLCTFMSNVATPVLIYSLIQPTLRALPLESDFSKQLILAVCFASNIGGMASPIASPQNVVGAEEMTKHDLGGVSWGSWLLVAYPVSIISIVLCWALLLVGFRGATRTVPSSIFSAASRNTTPLRFGLKMWIVIIGSVATIILWMIDIHAAQLFGQPGIIGLIPIVLFFGFGILSKDDFNSLPWSTIMLASGATIFGHAVEDTGLMGIAGGIIKKIMVGPNFVQVALVSLLITFLVCFFSHTVGALIFIPMVEQASRGIGSAESQVLKLMFMTVFACSAGMALPFGSFPNMAATSMENGAGRPYITTGQFIIFASIATIIVYSVCATLGYGLMAAASINR